MKRICDDLQTRLAGDGPQGLREDVEAQRHLESCEECFALMEALATLDRGLGAMPALDASEQAVRELLARVGSDQRADSSDDRPTPLAGLVESVRAFFRAPRPLGWSAVGVAAVVAVFGLWMTPLLIRARMPAPSMQERPAEPAREKSSDSRAKTPAEDPARKNEGTSLPSDDLDELASLGYLAGDVEAEFKDDRAQSRFRAPVGEPVPAATPMPAAPPALPAPAPERQLLRDEAVRDAGLDSAGEGFHFEVRGDQAEADLEEQVVEESAVVQAPQAMASSKSERLAKATETPAYVEPDSSEEVTVEGAEGGVAGATIGGVVGGRAAESTGRQALRVGDGVEAPERLHYVRPAYPDEAAEAGAAGDVVLEIEVDEQGRVSLVRIVESLPLLDQAATDAVTQWRYAPTLVDGQPVPVRMEVTVTFPPAGGEDEARAFLEERDRVAGLSFRPARGYWQNSYVPGDPALRLLQARLADWSAGGHALSRPPDRLLDAPADAALGLTLRSDRAALDGPSRALVQVGLQAGPRASGRRPSMNVALVLDLDRALPVDAAASFRALATAFARARRAGDHFSLVLAGCPEPVVLPPGDLRHGPVAVAVDEQLGSTPSGPRDLSAALAAAIERVGNSDDSDAPLGSSAILFATARALGSEAESLSRLAHRSALAGIPVTAVGIGPGVALRGIDRLALAGQGSRRLLDTPADAASLLDRELAASSRAVARAVRLRIRLAPGVKLVDIVGSRPLGEVQAQRVRDAERSVDLRLARSLGIEADRGEDEDGIQIVIPTFYAGDSHAVLLDVVAPGPGPIAEVAALYKDVAFLRNGVARASLSLPRRAEAGPLHGGVLASLLAARLSEELTRAASLVGAGQTRAAAEVLRAARRLRVGLGSVRPDLAGDRGIARDVAMLDDYLATLDAGTLPARLADSLRCAGRLKVIEPTQLSGT
jgi:Ca-activated chloride channel family protein